MALYKYFKIASDLPNPNGPLSAVIPSESIASTNKKVEPLLKKPESSAKQGPYLVYTDEERLMVGKRAAEMGVASTLRFYQKQLLIAHLRRVQFEPGQQSTSRRFLYKEN